MTLSELGSIGELVGGLAVIATLIYLAVQIRQNSVAVRAQIRQQISNQQYDGLTTYATDPVVRSAFMKLNAALELSDEEATALGLMLYGNLRIWENYHTQMLLGNLTQEEWNVQVNGIRRILTQSVPINWNDYRAEFEPKFAAEMDRILGSGT